MIWTPKNVWTRLVLLKPLLLGLGILSLTACGREFAVPSPWVEASTTPDLASPDWAKEISVEGSDFQIQALNDAHYLYLYLSTDSDALKSQLLGAYHQSLDLWFDPGMKGKFDRGIKLIFHHMPGVGFPKADAEQHEYWVAETQEMDLLAKDLSGYPKVMIPNNNIVYWNTSLSAGTLVYGLKIPLQALQAGAWAIGAEAGQRLGISIDSSAISRQAAMAELQREYVEEVMGWGWSRNGYGPKPDEAGRGGFGLGDYDDYGLDNSIYATHHVYGHLSLDAVPTTINCEAVTLLSAPPQP